MRRILAAVAVTSVLAGCTTVTARRPLAEPPEPPKPPAFTVEAETFVVAATGDILLHDILVQQGVEDSGAAHINFRPMLKPLAPVISGADLAMCHLETPVATRFGPFSGYPTFNVPPQITRAIKALGYDTCSVASNHTIDQGYSGVQRTLDALDATGIRHAGAARDAEEARRITMLDVRGVRVAQLSYTYGTNGMAEPVDSPWLVNDDMREETILSDARRARREGAEVVILSMHWGTEYQHEPDAQQRELAQRLLASPSIDLIVGHHAHVVQPFDRINGKWVAYGLGNLVANPVAGLPATHQGVVALFTFTRDGEGEWRVTPSFVPTMVSPGPPIRLVDLRKELRRDDLPSTTLDEYRDAVRHTAGVVTSERRLPKA